MGIAGATCRRLGLLDRPFSRTMTAVLLAAGVLATGPSSARADAPKRVVSFNVCADQLVVALADPEQIAGLSPYATDPMLSVVAEEARKYRRLDWQAESTIPLTPDLVLTGAWDRAATRQMLTRVGIRVVQLDLVTGIASARAEIVRVAELLGHPERGARLAAALDSARARLAAVPRTRYSTALVIDQGRFTAGTATIAASLLAEAGLRPPEGAPASFGGFVPLEKLLMLKPDLVFLKDPPGAPTDQGALYFTHPALRALYPPERRIVLPERLSMCGGPALVAALDYLAGVMAKLASGK
jgi:iron complex transport system substrate-binding protein